MASLAFFSTLRVLLLSYLFAFASCASVQFVQQSAGIQFVLSTTANGASTDLQFRLQAPQSAGWGAVGVGSQMAGAMMFVLVPEGQNNATVSIRTAGGESTPSILSGVHYEVQNAGLSGSQMFADVICHGCTNWSGGGSLDTSSTQAPFIWAVGPGSSGAGQTKSKRASSASPPGSDVQIAEHSQHGTFSLDMTAARSAPSSSTSSSPPPPQFTSTNATSSTIQSESSMGDNPDLVTVHAVLLGGSFVFLFPIGVVCLRWGSGGTFKGHWVVQAVATLCSVIGFIIAIAFSVMGGEYVKLNQPHQVLGIAVVLILLFQLVFGYLHHQRYQQLGRRTLFSHLHLWTGRVVIILGMVNASLGFVLSGSNGYAGVSAIVAAAMTILTVSVVVHSGYIKKKAEAKMTEQTWHRDNVRLVTVQPNHRFP